MRSIMENPEATGRISKWPSEMRSYGLRYEPRAVIKGQVLADFIIVFTPGATEHTNQLERWILNVNGTLNSRGQASKLTSPLQKDPSSNSPLLSASLLPTMKPSTRQS